MGVGEGATRMLKKVFVLLFSAVLIVSCSRGNAVTADTGEIPDVSGSVYALDKAEDLEDAFSYVFGYMLASSAGIYGGGIDFQYAARGVMDYGSGTSLFTADEMSAIASEYQRETMAEAQARFDVLSDQNKSDAEGFLDINGQRNGVITTPSGLQYEILSEGDGSGADENSYVTVDYRITLLDGTLADSSYERGLPTSIALEDAIPGFREGVALMHEGDRFRFWIPPELGFGIDAPSGIGPNALLIMDVYLRSADENSGEDAGELAE